MTEMNPASFSISTFGCKVNQYESQVIREKLVRAGYREDEKEPDLILVNTCAVTAKTEAKVRKKIRSILRDHPASPIILAGCGVAYSRRAGKKLLELIPPERRGELPPDVRPGPDEGISSFRGRHRAFLKVQDGCDSYCSYCVIPYLRGPSRSRPAAPIMAEIRRLRENGYREFVLTGIHLGKYGRDLSPPLSLSGLVAKIRAEKGKYRLRLSSIEPRELSPGLIAQLGLENKLCPHLHIPLQSGSDRILQLMNRNYTFRDYRRVVETVRKSQSDIALSTDCLVGFPGETDEDFDRTCRAIAEIGFCRVHIFPYSRRFSTRAAAYPVLPSGKIKERLTIIRSLAERVARDYRRKLIGRIVTVILEDKDGEGVKGTDEYYNRVTVAGVQAHPGEFCRVRIISAGEKGCRGEPAR